MTDYGLPPLAQSYEDQLARLEVIIQDQKDTIVGFETACRNKTNLIDTLIERETNLRKKHEAVTRAAQTVINEIIAGNKMYGTRVTDKTYDTLRDLQQALEAK